MDSVNLRALLEEQDRRAVETFLAGDYPRPADQLPTIPHAAELPHPMDARLREANQRRAGS